MTTSQSPAESSSAVFPRTGPPPPAWLSQVTEALSDGLESAPAAARRLQRELARAGGVPFTVIHAWGAGTVSPLLAEVSAQRGGSPSLHRAVGALHTRALAGEQITEEVWSDTLEPALREVYQQAYAYSDAYARASAAARAFALSRQYAETEATEYGRSYAGLNTDAGIRFQAAANARANASLTARAFASADAAGYADSWPYAQVRSWAAAYAGGDEARRQDAFVRLTAGFSESLALLGPA